MCNEVTTDLSQSAGQNLTISHFRDKNQKELYQ